MPKKIHLLSDSCKVTTTFIKLFPIIKPYSKGEVYPQHMFPFPGAERLSEDERDTLEMMVDPADSVRFKFEPNMV